MTEDMRAIRDDLAFMRALAEEGRRAPLLGGSILAVAGATFGLASLGHWAVASGAVRASPGAVNLIWLAGLAVFMAALWILKARIRERPGARSPGNRAFGVVWQALGFAIFTLFIALALASWRAGTALPMSLLAPVITGLYGAGWWVAASLSDRPWIRLVSLGAFAAAVGLGFLAGRPEQYLIYAAVLFGAAFLPGVALMRQEPSEVV